MAARKFRQPPVWDAIDHAARALDKTADLEVKYINSYKGRGVFAKAPFLKGDFVVEYRGELISSEESQRRRSIYHSRCTVFMFDFYCRDRAWCVDAAQEDGSLGRLVNDDHYHPNCKIKKLVTEGKARLFLFALKDINVGEEITYDYGEVECTWRKKAGPQTAISESSRATEEAHQRPSLYQMETETLSSDSEVSVAEEDQDSLSGPGLESLQMKSLHSEIDCDSDELFEPYSDNSGDDYVPYTSEDDSDGTDTGEDVEPLPLIPTQDTNNGSLKQLPDSASSPHAEDGGGSLRTTTTYNQKQYCLFCKSGVGDIARHLEQAHHNEPEVTQALSFPEGSKERQMCLQHLTSRGNFAHSVDVSNAGKPGVQAPCASSLIEVKGEFGKLFLDMIQDEVYFAVKSDVCIVAYGQDLYDRLKYTDVKKQHVRHKLRELGRLLICSRKTSPMRTIHDHFTPANFMHVVRAVKLVAGFDGDTNTYKSPSVALKLGNGLARIARLLECSAKEQNDRGAAKDARAFRRAYGNRWNELVSAPSLKALRGTKYNAPPLLAFTEDVQTLHCYLDVQQQRAQRDLSRRSSPLLWARLAKATMTQVALFNRRRTGEVSKTPLSAYVSPNPPEPQEDVNAALSLLEKNLCPNARRVAIRGKRGTRVVVLLTPAMQRALDLLVSKRQECKVPPGNAYLFARPGAPTCYRGSDSLRHYARLCGAKNPVSLTCAKLRRQMGTLSLVLNLGDAELHLLAKLLGHGVSVHRQFYRLPEGTLQLAKISKVLMELDRGRLAGFKGLEDISIDPDENVQMDSGNEVACESDSQDSRITSSQREDSEATDVSHMDASEGRRSRKKRRWRREEVLAVEKHFMSFITSHRVPGKRDCEACLGLETEALGNRSWAAIKYYVNNRIQALKRKASKSAQEKDF